MVEKFYIHRISEEKNQMKKIIIEDGLSLKQERGIGQYSKRLFEILIQENQDVEMNRKIFLENIKNSTLRRLLYFLWLNTFFLFKLFTYKKETICIFTATMTPIIRIPNIKYYSVIHDIRSIVHPELSTTIQNFHANLVNQTAIKFAHKILTVSKTMKQEICNAYSINDDKINIIYNTSSIQNIEYDTKEKILKKLKLSKKSYLFFIGGLDKNKNVEIIISSFDTISNKNKDLKLVIAGNTGNANIQSTNPNILFTGFVSNQDVKVLYQNALIYLFPSLYEGFGIPILDSQISGVPVICSDIPIFREVAGNGAEFCKPTEQELTKSIEKLLTSQELQNSLKQSGYINVQRFSLNTIKLQLMEVIK